MNYTKAQNINIKYSFIVPVYNVDKYLSTCMESIINQTFKSWEIILINDKSTDKSLNICKSYSLKHNNIITIENNNNVGLAETRNIGLNHASGEWIIFIDSDDYIKDKNFLEVLDKKTTNADTVFYGYTIFKDKTNEIIKSKYNNISKINTFNNISEIIDYLSKTKNWCWSACMHAYKFQFLKDNNLLFNSSFRQAEDCVFFYKAMICNPKIKAIDSGAYMYRIREKSLTQTPADTTLYGIKATMETAKTVNNATINENHKTSLLNTISYNYITTLINIQNNLNASQKDRELKKMKSFSYLNNYGRGIKIKVSQLIIKIFGIKTGSKILAKTRNLITN